nr:subclass B3 metallo-beta-lactamase [Massilia sp. REN29]
MKLTSLAFAAAGLVTCVAPATADDWNTPQEPFALSADSYYVGTRGLSSVLVASKDGHILIDGATAEAAPLIAANVRKLGFKVEDIRIILNSHEHMDHAGGIAELQRLSGAEVKATPAAAPVLRSGQASRGDPQYGSLPAMAPVARVTEVRDGETVKLGPLAVTLHATPGHTQGGSTWTWRSQAAGKAVDMVYADSLTAIGAGAFRYSGDPAYPTARRDIERSIARVAALPCDVLVSAHPEASGLWQRQARGALVDKGACRAYADKGRAWLAKTLATEAKTAPIVWRDDARIGEMFEKAGVTGTLVVHDVATGEFTGHDRQRASIRYVPASTFKIPNSLIGLDAGAVADVDEVLPYGGGPTLMPQWARDMPLREAIRVSNVPVYKELARRIGMPRMREGLRKLDYGNMNAGNTIDTFWLEGPLKISAVEQVRFLGRLAQDRLPFPKPAMAAVREIVRQEGAANLYAKTGWYMPDDRKNQIGWWVGWVEKDGKVYAFAMNVDITDDTVAAKRVPLGKAALQSLGLL